MISSKWYDSRQIRYISTSICDIQFPDNYLAFRCTALGICSHYKVGPRNEAMKVRRSCLFHAQQHADFLKQFHSSLQWTSFVSLRRFYLLQKINSHWIYWAQTQCIILTHEVHLKTKTKRWVVSYFCVRLPFCEYFLFSHVFPIW